MMVNSVSASGDGVPFMGAVLTTSSDHCIAGNEGASGSAISGSPWGTPVRSALVSSILPTKQALVSLCSRI
jgi:hypothetical protein